ncbi:hypothetical protein AMTRI_Chr02g254420 [Amborella trichopoda]
MMPCFIPFSNNNLQITFFAFKPHGGCGAELVDSLKRFSFWSEALGCAYAAVFKSIHGNLVVWYGAWTKRSTDQGEIANIPLVQALLRSASHQATILDTGLFQVCFGESKDGIPASKFSSGDTVSIHMLFTGLDNLYNLTYGCMALAKSYFSNVEGVSSASCLSSLDNPKVLCLHVWKSLDMCYSWLLGLDGGTTMRPLISHLVKDIKYDVFKVVYVMGDEIMCLNYPSGPLLIGTERGN